MLILCSCSKKEALESSDDSTRVVSLAPNITEIIFAIGAEDLLVGRTSACDYPQEAVGQIPVIGGFGKPALELLLRTEPNLVLQTDLEDEVIGQAIDRIGLTRKRIECSKLEHIASAIREIGVLLDRKEVAEEVAQKFEMEFDRLTTIELKSDRLPKVFVELWDNPLITVGRKSFVSELVTVAGGSNIGDAIQREYFNTESEWVVKTNPDIIICLYMSPTGVAREKTLRRTGWSSVSALVNGDVYDEFDSNVLLRPGPRITEGIESLRKCFEQWQNRQNRL